MGQDLRTRAEAEGVAAHHPGSVTWNVTLPDSSNPEAKRQGHRRTGQKSEGVNVRTVKTCRRLDSARKELGHPQARERSDNSARNQNSPGSTMPLRIAAAKTGGKLEGAEETVDGDADKVRHHRQR